jgi:hypothetical protein
MMADDMYCCCLLFTVQRVSKLPYVPEDADEFERAWLALADIHVAGGKFDLAQVTGTVNLSFWSPGGGGLPPAGHTQRNQANPIVGGPRQSLTSEIHLIPLSQKVPSVRTETSLLDCADTRFYGKDT